MKRNKRRINQDISLEKAKLLDIYSSYNNITKSKAIEELFTLGFQKFKENDKKFTNEMSRKC